MKSKNQVLHSKHKGQVVISISKISLSLMPLFSSTQRLSIKGSRREQKKPSTPFSRDTKAGSKVSSPKLQAKDTEIHVYICIYLTLSNLNQTE